MDIMDIFDRFDYSLSHLAFIRKKKWISQQELGDFLGVSLSTISSWENGGYSGWDLKIIKKLVDYFSVPSWLFLEKTTEEELELYFAEKLIEKNVDWYVDGKFLDYVLKKAAEKEDSDVTLKEFLSLMVDGLNDHGRQELFKIANELSRLEKYKRK